MSYNPGLLFYKHYYQNIDFKILLDNNLKDGKEKEWKKTPSKNPFYYSNKTLFDFKLPKNMGAYPILGNSKFECTTTYPGLLIGTGYPHGSGVMGEFKIGFFFDYTTGLPVIPGSSVKGLLRSAFPENYFKKEKALKKKAEKTDNVERKKKLEEEAENWKYLGNRRKLFIQALLKSLKIETDETDFIKRLENEIFEGIYGWDEKNNPKRFPLCQRDIFHDAIISASNTGKVFADDYITPHKNPKNDGIPDALKNPTPIQMLKVLPGVTFRFQFDLKENFLTKKKPVEGGTSKENKDRLLSPKEREDLFKSIIQFLGVGAKTNVGYGQFFDSTEQEQVAGGMTGDTSTKRKFSKRHVDKVRQGEDIKGKLLRFDGNMAVFKLELEGYDQEVKTSKKTLTSEQVGKNFYLKLANKGGKKNKWQLQVNLMNMKPLNE